MLAALLVCIPAVSEAQYYFNFGFLDSGTEAYSWNWLGNWRDAFGNTVPTPGGSDLYLNNYFGSSRTVGFYTAESNGIGGISNRWATSNSASTLEVGAGTFLFDLSLGQMGQLNPNGVTNTSTPMLIVTNNLLVKSGATLNVRGSALDRTRRIRAGQYLVEGLMTVQDATLEGGVNAVGGTFSATDATLGSVSARRLVAVGAAVAAQG